jgi:hypothetical protein
MLLEGEGGHNPSKYAIREGWKKESVKTEYSWYLFEPKGGVGGPRLRTQSPPPGLDYKHRIFEAVSKRSSIKAKSDVHIFPSFSHFYGKR